MPAARPHKESVITFKADASLLEALRSIPNRSEFIRSAILAALENYCPLCRGTGVLSPNQKNHWEEFARNHALQECDECHEVHLICAQDDTTSSRRPAAAEAAARPAAARRHRSTP
ncbi:MAG: ribbon-helix-helix domain-containing protein [Planctomycetota bacterium]